MIPAVVGKKVGDGMVRVTDYKTASSDKNVCIQHLYQINQKADLFMWQYIREICRKGTQTKTKRKEEMVKIREKEGKIGDDYLGVVRYSV